MLTLMSCSGQVCWAAGVDRHEPWYGKKRLSRWNGTQWVSSPWLLLSPGALWWQIWLSRQGGWTRLWVPSLLYRGLHHILYSCRKILLTHFSKLTWRWNERYNMMNVLCDAWSWLTYLWTHTVGPRKINKCVCMCVYRYWKRCHRGKSGMVPSTPIVSPLGPLRPSLGMEGDHGGAAGGGPSHLHSPTHLHPSGSHCSSHTSLRRSQCTGAGFGVAGRGGLPDYCGSTRNCGSVGAGKRIQ